MMRFRSLSLCYQLLFALLLLGCAEETVIQDTHVIAPNKTIAPAAIIDKPARSITAPKTQSVDSTEPYHEVIAGETLYSIGVISGEGYQRLAQWNHIAPPYKIIVGEKIRLSTPNTIENEVKNTITRYQKPPSITEKPQSVEEKKSSISIDNGSMLKLNFKWPLRGIVVKTFSETINKGIDIEGLEGQPVRATAAGKVVHSGLGLIGFGQLLIIKHTDEYLSAYSNNERLLVSEGQFVEQGQAIAELGNTGIKRTVLHFEIRKNGKAVNPLELLPNTY